MKRILLSLPVGLLCLVALPGTADAQDCSTSCGWHSCATPAYGVPVPQGHGLLEPVDQDQLPSDRDTTDFNYNAASGEIPGFNNPLWIDLDIEDDTVFTAVSHGLHLWNIDDTDGTLDRVGGIRVDDVVDSHETYPTRSVAAPPGRDDVVGVGQVSQGGVVIFDTSSRASPREVYQDHEKSVRDLVAGRIGTTDYLFAATNEGVLAYDLSAAKTLSTSCNETSPGGSCGVYRATVVSSSGDYLAGVGNSTTTKYWLALPGGSTGVEIFDASNPGAAEKVVSGLSDRKVYGVALWRDGESYFLGLRSDVPGVKETEARIYDVSCLATGSCQGLGTPVWTRPGLPRDVSTFYVTHSSAGGRHYLYYGAFNVCGSFEQNEWLFDVTEPTESFDLTPAPFEHQFEQMGYWDWYYKMNGGFNGAHGFVGKFHGAYFYRAAHSILDIHRLVGGIAPGVEFSWDGASDGRVYEGSPVDFRDESSGAPDSWAWLFPGGTPGTSNDQHPQDVLFTAGTPTVELDACNSVDCSTGSETVTVHDTAPQVASIEATPQTVLQCGTVQLEALGPGGGSPIGLPPLDYAWTVDGSAISGSGSTTSWTTSELTAAGSHELQVLATNSLEESGSATTSVTVDALPALGISDLTHDPFDSNVVQFHLDAQGATEWCWDFDLGDGVDACASSSTNWTTDPSEPGSGTDPVHTFDEKGTYDVQAHVRNCVEGPVTAKITVEIVNLELLVASFKAECGVWGCNFEVNETITFNDGSSGNPDTWDYDWNGDGVYEDTGNGAPVTNHSYSAAGDYRPRLRVWRGTESKETVHAETISVSQLDPPSISIIGSSSGSVGEELSYYASASNCTPSSTGWSWSTDGASGSSTGSSITLSWSAAGTKHLSVTNSACGSARGTKSVSITAETGTGDCGPVGGDGLQACIQKTEDGLAVTLDGSGSAGSPTSYGWELGDGTTASGPTVTHTYGADGTYTVELEVSKSGDCVFGTCTASHSIQVSVQGDGGDPGPDPEDPNCGAAGPEGLQACFVFDPEEPQFGTEVGFDGSGSKGAPESFAWDFGGGEKTGSDLSGAQVAHTFDEPGTYEVTLEVSKEIRGSACPFGVCTASVTRPIEVFSNCREDRESACLNNHRFLVEAEWWTENGDSGTGKAKQLTDDTGYFWFFDEQNVEIVVKVLDGSEITGHYWVFYGALTNVGFELTVTDTETGDFKEYINEPGQFASQGDVQALPSTSSVSDGLEGTMMAFPGGTDSQIDHAETSHCSPSKTRLCINDRFAVTVHFRDHEDVEGDGRATLLTDDTGYFWFFDPNNVEIVLKVLDGREVNGNFWVYYASLTDVMFDLTVEDLVTGEKKTYHNDAEHFASSGDIEALHGD